MTTYTLIYTVLDNGSVDATFHHNTKTGRIKRGPGIRIVIAPWKKLLPMCGAKDASTRVLVRVAK